MGFTSVNPVNGETLETYDEMASEEVFSILEHTQEAFLSWRETTFAQRRRCMEKAAEILRQRRDELARIMTQEMGKAITEARGEVEKCAWVCEYYAKEAEKFLHPEPIESDAGKSYVGFRPLGIVLAVMPWNFPFWQVFRFAAPALMAGNAGVLKHASNVPHSALAIEEVFQQAGFPEHLFRTLLISSKQVDAVIEDERIVATTLTGSDIAGRKVAAKSGQMLKKTVMELGGSDPFVVLADADVDEAARQAARARCINCGQSCIAAKRFIIEEKVYDQFLERFQSHLQGLKVGDPMDPETQLGPMARHDLRQELHEQVQASVAKGARLLMGGEVPEGPGAFYPVTLLTDITPDMPAYKEEFFGPVALVFKAADMEEAVSIANDSPFGLGGSVWTQDTDKGEAIAARIEAGAVFVNGMVKSDPRLPFGGVKLSGFGRELSHYGIKEFVNIQTVWVA